MAVDQVLPDGHRVAPTLERLVNQLSIRLARARTGRTARARGRARVGGHLRPGGRFWPIRVGGHLAGNCRFCAPSRWTPPAWWPVLGARPAGVRPGRAPECRPLSDTRWPFPVGRRWSLRCAEATSRVARAPRFVAVVLVQDVAHGRDGAIGLPRPSTSRSLTRGGRFSGVDRWPVLGVYRGMWKEISVLVFSQRRRCNRTIGAPVRVASCEMNRTRLSLDAIIPPFL